MSYYRGRYQRRSYNRRPALHFAPPTEVARLRQQARRSAHQFVLAKFFALSPSEYQRYSSWYREKHGPSAHDYLQKTYTSWKHRSTGMSPQTSMRVLEGVPRIMSRHEQFQLLRFYLPYVLCTPRELGRSLTIGSSELPQFYAKAGDSIITQTFDLDWFVSAVFSADELTAFQNVIRFILLRRLEASFVDVKSDLILLHNSLRTLQAEVTLHYQIDFFGARVAVSDMHAVANQQLVVTLPPITKEDLALQELKSILADTALNDSLKLHFGSEIQSLGIKDLGRVVQQAEAVRADQEMDSQMGIEGRGGIAQLRIIKRSVSKIKTQIALHYGWMAVVCIILTIIAKSTLGGVRPSFGPIFIAGFFGVPVLIGLRESIKQLKSTLHDYEHRKSNVFAPDKSK